MATFSQQEREAAAHGAALTVWPETAFPGYFRYSGPLGAAVTGDAVRNRQTSLVASMDEDAGRKQADQRAVFGHAAGADCGEIYQAAAGAVRRVRAVPAVSAVSGTDAHDRGRRQPGAPGQPLLDAGPPIGKIGVGDLLRLRPMGRSCASRRRRGRTCWSSPPTTTGTGGRRRRGSTRRWPPSGPRKTTAISSAARRRACRRSSRRRGRCWPRRACTGRPSSSPRSNPARRGRCMSAGATGFSSSAPCSAVALILHAAVSVRGRAA